MVVAEFSTGSSAFSLLTQNTVIPSTGLIGLPGVVALSGSSTDIQAAVDAVNNAGGGVVYVPAGTFHWNGQKVTIPGGVSVLGASLAGCTGHESNWQNYNATVILHNDAQPTSSYVPPSMFYLDGSNGRQTRISGIRFEATGPLDSTAENTGVVSAAIRLLQAKNFRIDHCTFINFCYQTIYAAAFSSYSGVSAYGLVDHCTFDLPYKDTTDSAGTGWLGGYGVHVSGNMRTDLDNWAGGISSYAGRYEAINNVALVITEDCHFSRCRHAIDGNNGAMLVTRYCLFDNPASYQFQPNNIGEIDSHGGGWDTMTAVVCAEAYNNTITGKPNFATRAIRIRGGSGLFYSNHFHPPDTGGVSPTLQALIELDQDSTVPQFQVTQTYIWNNDYSNCYFIRNTIGLVENVDYFLRAPALAQDGWIYTPYLYPHPSISS